MAELCESITERSAIDRLRVLIVELLEQRLYALTSCELLNWESGSDELVIVDDTVAIDIDFFQDVLQLSVS